MDFMNSILPSAVDKWKISNGSMSESKVVLHTGGSITCTLTQEEIEYIPSAFQVRVKHTSDVDWKKPTGRAILDITYEDGEVSQTVVPLNITDYFANEATSVNVAFVRSSTYSIFKCTFENTSSEDLTFVLWELRPSIDMDDKLYSNIESMLPQLIYAFNTSDVTAQAGVDTQVVQLPVSVKQDTNLLLHLTITGTTTGDTLTCTVKMDGETLKSFPVKQTTPEGHFFFGIPSLIAFVKTGPHIVTAHISAADSSVTVPKENALIVLDGKGILGGAGGSYPHAEVIQEILLANMPSVIAQDVMLTTQEPTTHAIETQMPMSYSNLEISIAMDIVRYGEVLTMDIDIDGNAPFEPYDSSVYYVDIPGLKAVNKYTAESTTEVLDECILVTLEVDTTKFDPVYTRVLEEV